jgi:AraC family transcriptional regulator, regulatory protein of adaptative response / methylated-DNA-[protein]-cysteine methyltransferase
MVATMNPIPDTVTMSGLAPFFYSTADDMQHDLQHSADEATDTRASDTSSSNTSSSDYQMIAAAIAYLEANHRSQPSLEELAAHLAISPFHLQRLFKRWAGISPKRFVQFLTVEHAKELLVESRTMLDAAYETGLSGPGRLHDLFVNVEAMTPGEFKLGGHGLTIQYGFHVTPFGECLLAMTERGVCGLNFVGEAGRDAELAALRRRWPAADLYEEPVATAAVVDSIFAPAQGDEIRLLLAGTNFQIKVWEALLRIPPGSACTYEDVAQWVGQPSAARAVGGAVGANAIAYLIPCHRVIRKSGVIKEYRWGSTRKKAILGWEAGHSHTE